MVDKSKYIKKFKEIYQKKTGKVLSDGEALEYFQQLVTLVDAICRPVPEDKINNLNN